MIKPMRFGDNFVVTDIQNVHHNINKSDIIALYPGKIVLKNREIINILPNPEYIQLLASRLELEDKVCIENASKGHS